MFRIITIEREYGAGGGHVARELAQRLGWRLYDQQLTAEIARRADVHPEAVRQCDEQRDPLFYRLAKVFWRGSYERAMPWPADRAFDADTLVRAALAALFKSGADPLSIMKWKEIYDLMETATDRCEDVANVIEGVVLEHA